MAPDWTKLSPNRPLSPGESTYVERASDEPGIADWVLAGEDVVLVAGPAGVGKSTELAHAAHQISASRFTALVPLDRQHNMRTLLSSQVRDAVVSSLEEATEKRAGLPTSRSRRISGDNLRDVAREVSRLLGTRPCLLIDGLDKAPLEVAREALDALRFVQPEVSLVVVVPWTVVYGPHAHLVLAPGEKLIIQRPVEVGNADAPGTRFLLEMATKRLDLESGPAGFDAVLGGCASLSGGVPRTFLQLLSGAGTWARLSRSAAWPDDEDLRRAAGEHRDSFRRLLLPGDVEALRWSWGTDGREMEFVRKLRLLAHGMLLEREVEGRVVMQSPPLVRAALVRDEMS